MRNLIDATVEQVIGFEYLTCQMTIKSSYGIKHMNAISPYTYTRKDELLHEYDLIDAFLRKYDHFERIETILSKLKDILGIVNNCLNNKILDLIDLYEIKLQAIYMNQLREIFNEEFKIPLLALDDVIPIIYLLSNDKNHITTEFYVYNTYSVRLKQIREEKRKIEQLYYNSIDEKEKQNFMVLRSECIIAEEEEELNVRKELSEQLKEQMDKMKDNIYKIGYIDALITKAKLARVYGGVRPEISHDELCLTEMVNPLIKDKVEELGNDYTRNSITITKGATVLTGANMSGKSAVLKTVLLNVVLAHLGFYVFAKEALIPLFDGVKYIGVDNESLVHGLSSFGQEVSKINETIKEMKEKRCLVLVDEFARSTNPYEGQKFVKAFVEYANTFSSYTILATHYDGVVSDEINHYQIVGLKKDALQNKLITIQNINKYMDYSLKRVSFTHVVPKEAYNVSLLLGIDQDYLKYLDKCYGE